MKYSVIENPSLYDNVRYYSVFSYTDEIQLEEELFTLEIIELNVINSFKDEFTNRYLALIALKSLEKAKLDINELKSLIEEECYDIDIENVYILFIN